MNSLERIMHRLARLVPPDSAANLGLLVASAAAPGTAAPSLSGRGAADQGLITGLSTGLTYLLTVAAQDTLHAAAVALTGDAGAPSAGAAGDRHGARAAPGPAAIVAADLAAIPLGLAVRRLLPPWPGEPLARGLLRQAGWRFAVTGAGGAVLVGVHAGVRWLDSRLGARGRIAALPVAVPASFAVAYAVQRRRNRPGPAGRPGTPGRAGAPGHGLDRPPRPRSLAVAGAVVGGTTAAAYAEHLLVDRFGRRMAAASPVPREVWRVLGHAALLAGLGAGAARVWHEAMRRIEAGTAAGGPGIAAGDVGRWLAPTISGGPASLVSWRTLGREGRRHALSYARPEPVPDRPAGLPDLSIRTVMGRPARATPVQVYVGLDAAASARERVDLALAEMDRTGAFDRELIVLVSPTGTGYVNYVAVAAAQYLALGDIATVTLQYSKRPSPLSLGMVRAAREQNRLLWLRVLERVRDRTGRRPRVVLFGESLGAHTSQDVFLHWGTLGLESLGIDRALWIGTPGASRWMRQVVEEDRLDVDRDALAVVNDFAQLAGLGPDRLSRVRYVLLSHDNDGVTRFAPDLLTSAPRWLGPDRPRPQPPVGAGSPRGIPPGMRWRPVTTFFQTLIDMKNAQVRGAYLASGHDYRPDLVRFISAVYGLPATDDQIARVEEAVRRRETAREHLWAAVDHPEPDRAVALAGPGAA